MKHLLKIVFALTIILSLSACSEEINLMQKSHFLSLDDFKVLAQNHNKAMDHVLNGLKYSEATSIKNKSNLGILINLELNSFYSNTYGEDKGIAVMYSEKEVMKIFNEKSTKAKNDSSSLSPIQAVINEYFGSLSSEIIILLNELEVSLNNAPNDFDSSIYQINSIEETAQNELTEIEAQIILAGAEIGKASLEYWRDNINEWQQVLSDSNTNYSAKSWFSWGDVAGADVAGAVGGAVGAAVVNVVPGVGQVGYAGAILGGAAGSSAASAVSQIWNAIF